MIPTTNRTQRKKRLQELRPKSFDNYRDFFISLHLNSYTQIMHLTGAMAGIISLIFSIYLMSFGLFLLYAFFFYGLGFLSHYIFDGHISRTAKEAPWGSFIYAVELNWLCLTRRMPELEKKFLKKYPFVKSAYLD